MAQRCPDTFGTVGGWPRAIRTRLGRSSPAPFVASSRYNCNKIPCGSITILLVCEQTAVGRTGLVLSSTEKTEEKGFANLSVNSWLVLLGQPVSCLIVLEELRRLAINLNKGLVSPASRFSQIWWLIWLLLSLVTRALHSFACASSFAKFSGVG